jgi:hypothetical protein
VRVQTLTVRCDIAGCARLEERVLTAGVAPVKRALHEDGWRLGAVRDVCPDCHAKGHRP